MKVFTKITGALSVLSLGFALFSSAEAQVAARQMVVSPAEAALGKIAHQTNPALHTQIVTMKMNGQLNVSNTAAARAALVQLVDGDAALAKTALANFDSQFSNLMNQAWAISGEVNSAATQQAAQMGGVFAAAQANKAEECSLQNSDSTAALAQLSAEDRATLTRANKGASNLYLTLMFTGIVSGEEGAASIHNLIAPLNGGTAGVIRGMDVLVNALNEVVLKMVSSKMADGVLSASDRTSIQTCSIPQAVNQVLAAQGLPTAEAISASASILSSCRVVFDGVTPAGDITPEKATETAAACIAA